jgi:branched-chain amino acid transport system substrate-binding protein
MKRALLVSVLAIPCLAFAQVKEQFVPINSYWVGPYAPGGSGIAAGMIDYFKLLNARDNGINGVKVTG